MSENIRTEIWDMIFMADKKRQIKADIKEKSKK